MRNIVLCLLLTGCFHQPPNPYPELEYIAVTADHNVSCAGGAGFVAWPADIETIRRQSDDLLIYANDCGEHCGVCVKIVFDGSVLHERLAFRDLLVTNLASLPGPTYVVMSYDDSPRSQSLYAELIIGTVTPH